MFQSFRFFFYPKTLFFLVLILSVIPCKPMAAITVLAGGDEVLAPRAGTSANLGYGKSYTIPAGIPVLGIGRSTGEGLPLTSSSDGRFQGYELAPDVFLLMYGSIIIYTKQGLGYIALELDAEDVTTTEDEDYASQIGSTAAARTLQSVTTKKNQYGNIGDEHLAFYLYAGPEAKPGTYTVPKLGVWYFSGVTLETQTTTVNSYNFNVISNKLECTVSPPSIIDFGQINLQGKKDGDSLGVRTGDLSISCTNSNNPAATAKATVSVTGTTARTNNTLRMNLEGSAEAPAEIRGLIGQNIQKTTICDGGTSYSGLIDFANTSQALDIGTFNVGNNTVPYSFSLCANGGNNMGTASATATINVTWE